MNLMKLQGCPLLTLISALITNYIRYKVWNEITYPFPNFNVIHSQTSTMKPLKFGKGQVISWHTFGMWLFLHIWIKVDINQKGLRSLHRSTTKGHDYVRLLIVRNWPFPSYCPACRTTLIATRFRVAVICPIIQVPHCIRVFFYFVWFVFINHIFQFYNELCTYCNILDIYLS